MIVPLLRRALVILSLLFALSVVTMLALAVVTWSTSGGGFPGSEWLVGLGFGALWVAAISPVLIAGVAVSLWIARRARETSDSPPQP